jgi:hypothetical protein
VETGYFAEVLWEKGLCGYIMKWHFVICEVWAKERFSFHRVLCERPGGDKEY